ncbi:hypothetical protein EK0264_11600 [Epidermidibacterium keratini]|uniref:Uncharacterized protein n=1 Tax=Epidermidibacterium keratini TaxID=1891644 RepID=A0A7L4YPP7_9ACTN|nr:hypothetical protein [Epidermidibacterium keratini]QHC00864.1 hypothetical protein EK0264_11600 [Epidermidibacterium keratini]
MAIVQYRKLWETEDKVRYEVAPVPEEKYGVEYNKKTEELGVTHTEAQALGEALMMALIHRQMVHDPKMTHLTEFPTDGTFRL